VTASKINLPLFHLLSTPGNTGQSTCC